MDKRIVAMHAAWKVVLKPAEKRSDATVKDVQREFHQTIAKNDDRLRLRARARKTPMPVVLSEAVLVIVIGKFDMA